jgi:CheY-like chemotaxis protein
MPPQEVLVCAKPSVARRAAGVLRSRGYAVETAGDGVRAVEEAERQNPDVVLIWSDLRGPDTGAVVRRVQEASGAKIAVIVGRDAIGRAAAFRDAGADAVLADRGNIDRLARVVDRLLEGGLVEDALALPGDDAFELEIAKPNGHGQHDEEPALPVEVPGFEVADPDEPGIDFQPWDVAEIVQEGAAEAARGYPSVVVQVATPPRLPAVAHRGALKGAVRALVEEACRDSDTGSDVTVKAQRVDAGIFVLVADRGPQPGHDPDLDTSGRPASGATLARALVALHGGILSVEPIPAGGRRASFTIPEHPPLLRGVELQGGFRALELLEMAEAAWRGDVAPTEEADPELLDQAIDLAAAAADAAAHAPERPRESEALADPIRSLAELFGFDDLAPVEALPEGQVEVEQEPSPAGGAQASEELEPDLETLFAIEPEDAGVEETPAAEVDDLVEPLPPEIEPEPLDAVEIRVADPEDSEMGHPGAIEPMPVGPEQAEREPLEPHQEEEDQEDEEPAAVITLPLEEEQAVEPEVEPIEVPEPVPAAEAASAEPATPVVPPKAFVPDPLHPATAILRALAEEYDTEPNPFSGR